MRPAARRPPQVFRVEVRWLVLDTDVRLLAGSCSSADRPRARRPPPPARKKPEDSKDRVGKLKPPRGPCDKNPPREVTDSPRGTKTARGGGVRRPASA